jgi:hypothetical protein
LPWLHTLPPCYAHPLHAKQLIIKYIQTGLLNGGGGREGRDSHIEGSPESFKDNSPLDLAKNFTGAQTISFMTHVGK